MGMVIPLERHLQIYRGEERRGEERERERELLTLLPILSYRAIRFSRQTDRQTDLSRLQRESRREREWGVQSRYRKSVSRLYISSIDKRCKIYSTCTCTSYRKHSQFRPKLHMCPCWCICVGVYCIYMCVSGPNKLHALTRRTHARTHYMYTWLTKPLPDARQLLAGERKPIYIYYSSIPR